MCYIIGRLHFNTRGAYFYTHYLLFLLKLYASLDGIDGFISKYIGCDLLRRCGIRKIVDSFTEKRDYEYVDNPILRLIRDVETSKSFPGVSVPKNFLLTRSLHLLSYCGKPLSHVQDRYILQ